MTEINDQSSDTSSDLNWPIEHQQHDKVVFENVADQYVKGENVTAFFTIMHDININPNEDQIGLLRVGCTNIKDCLAYAPVQINPSTASGSLYHGTATFSSSLLPVTDDEFYQFCYIINKTKNLGSSIPFQLNCALDDIDLLSNGPVGKTKSDSLIALADCDNEDIVVIHTKRMLTEEKLRQENRHLLDINRRLEVQKDECQTQLDLLERKTQEHIEKVSNDMKTLAASHKTAINELSSRQQNESKLRTEYDACQSLCKQYQAEALEHSEQCRIFEIENKTLLNDTNKLRSQLAVTSQLTKDQATQIIDLERRLMQSNELSKTSNQRELALEQQLRDFRLTTEKHQISLQDHLDATLKEKNQQCEQIEILEIENNLLKNEISALKIDNECLSVLSKKNEELSQELQQQVEQLQEQYYEKNESVQNQIETLKSELNETNSNQEAYTILKASYSEIEKRCVKHQKSEIEVKRQLSVYQKFVNDLQNEIQGLTERLSAGAEEYKALYRKYTALEQKLGTNQQQQQQQQNPTTILTDENVANDEELVALLQTVYENANEEEKKDNEDNQIPLTYNSLSNDDAEVRQCPMCYWEFPANMTIEEKNQHIEHHFQ